MQPIAKYTVAGLEFPIAAPVVTVMDGALTLTPPEHAVVGLQITAEVPKLLNAKVVAEGDALLSAEPGKVICIFPPLGIGFTVVNLIIWVAVIDVYIVVPAWWVFDTCPVKKTVLTFEDGVFAADIDATVAVLRVWPVSFSKTALSEAIQSAEL